MKIVIMDYDDFNVTLSFDGKYHDYIECTSFAEAKDLSSVIMNWYKES